MKLPKLTLKPVTPQTLADEVVAFDAKRVDLLGRIGEARIGAIAVIEAQQKNVAAYEALLTHLS